MLIRRVPPSLSMVAWLTMTCPTISRSSSATSAISETCWGEDRMRSTRSACSSEPKAAISRSRIDRWSSVISGRITGSDE